MTKLTVDEIVEAPNEEVLTSALSAPAVGVVVRVADRLPDAQPRDNSLIRIF